MKWLGVVLILLGVLILIFAVAARSELQAAATSETAPAPNTMPLTRMVGPELFDPGQASSRPAELAGKAMNRIYAIGGFALVLFVLGGIVLISSKRTNGGTVE